MYLLLRLGKIKHLLSIEQYFSPNKINNKEFCGFSILVADLQNCTSQCKMQNNFVVIVQHFQNIQFLKFIETFCFIGKQLYSKTRQINTQK